MTDTQTPYHYSKLTEDRENIKQYISHGGCFCETINDVDFVPRDFINEIIKEKPWENKDIYINIVPHHNLLIVFKTSDLKDFAKGIIDTVPSEIMAIEYCPFCGKKLPMDGFFGYRK